MVVGRIRCALVVNKPPDFKNLSVVTGPNADRLCQQLKGERVKADPGASKILGGLSDSHMQSIGRLADSGNRTRITTYLRNVLSLGILFLIAEDSFILFLVGEPDNLRLLDLTPPASVELCSGVRSGIDTRTTHNVPYTRTD